MIHDKKIELDWQPPMEWHSGDPKHATLVNHYALPQSSDLIGKPVAALKNVSDISMKIFQGGFENNIVKTTSAKVSLRVNGKTYFWFSGPLELDLRKTPILYVAAPNGINSKLFP
jgi:hypothetical protein